MPYLSGGHDDVYALCKRLGPSILPTNNLLITPTTGKFLPTRRTPGVSTSDLLHRIVAKYRRRDFDEKLIKMGHSELRAEGSDYDDLDLSSRFVSRVGSPNRVGSPAPGTGPSPNNTAPPNST